MHQIAAALPGHDSYFTPLNCDGFLEAVRRTGILEFSILGERHRKRCITYLRDHQLQIDQEGKDGAYDLVVTCSGLITPSNIRHSPVVLVQEGMTEPETFMYHLVRTLKFLPLQGCPGISSLSLLVLEVLPGFRKISLDLLDPGLV